MRWLRWGTIALTAFVALWTVGWFLVEPLAERRARATFERLAQRGVFVDYRDLSISGYPFRFDVAVSDATVTHSARGVAAAFSEATVAYSVFSPTAAIIRAPERVRLFRVANGVVWRGVLSTGGAEFKLRRKGSGVYRVEGSAQRALFAAHAEGGEDGPALRLDGELDAARGYVEVDLDGRIARGALNLTDAAARLREGDGLTAFRASDLIAALDAGLDGAKLSARLGALTLEDLAPGARAPQPIVDRLYAQVASAPLEPYEQRAAAAFEDHAGLAGVAADQDQSDERRAAGPRRLRALRVALAEMLAAGGEISVAGDLGRLHVHRRLDPSRAPLEQATIRARSVSGVLTIAETAVSGEATVGPIEIATLSSKDRGIEMTAARSDARMLAPLEPTDAGAPATASFRAEIADVAFSEDTLAKLYAPPRAEQAAASEDDAEEGAGEGALPARPDLSTQGVRIVGAAAFDVRENPLRRMLSTSRAAADAPKALSLIAATVKPAHVALLDLTVDAEAELNPASTSYDVAATAALRRWPEFVATLGRAGLFGRQILTPMRLGVGAFSTRPEGETDLQVIAFQRVNGEMSVNGKPLTR